MTTTGWVPIFDGASGWPSDPQACWDAGYRAIAGYVNEGSWKSFTPAMLAKWRTAAHPFGFAPMYEVLGTEPVTNPAVGIAHAHAARAGARRLGIPDSVAIAYAVDRDVTAGQIAGPVKTYFEHVKATDTATPIAYLENDGAQLVDAGVVTGLFTPAAYAWGNPPVLMTPANAPRQVIWTQEHNGVKAGGSGNVDAGHIRTTAPIWWPTTEGDDMPITDADALKIAQAVWNLDQIPNPAARADSPAHKPPGNNPLTQADFALGDMWNNTYGALAAIQSLASPSTVAAAVVAALPKGSGALLTEADVEAAVHQALSTLILTATPAPPVG